MNAYAYCAGNPVRWVDPSGLCPDEYVEYWQGQAERYENQAMWWGTAAEAARNVLIVDAAVGAATLYFLGPQIAAWFTALGAESAATASTSLRFRESTEHIFRATRDGHLPIDTPENRQIIQSAIRPENLASERQLLSGDTLRYYKVPLEDGTQAWAEVVNGVIMNGGVNQTPR